MIPDKSIINQSIEEILQVTITSMDTIDSEKIQIALRLAYIKGWYAKEDSVVKEGDKL